MRISFPRLLSTIIIVVGFGGGFFKDGKPSANAPETVAALKFIKGLYDEQLIPRGMEPNAYRQMFAQGKVAMYHPGRMTREELEVAIKPVLTARQSR